ncbi:50S ribosomal protein L23 [Candidatus Parcubacteria bacterium]|uniref:Large ribosomal subunit protein uL23 n=1 Tax=Candidatus Kaiserbacteria bacterium CG10_big_fil_rev_8_21_14_0_10_47_16 TaxID=1974608 RepID=A0A2H0UDQ1_9BACT|nr:50S ribosomal protein L23 [Candidatus Parcubacteria bacterium]PIR84539.1 MAG: 50S ribosomal protein L23 [Candidatus Kaiserbacteria bacterium CG10_big_fil_rev_8_21_14_0_10_47_16]
MALFAKKGEAVETTADAKKTKKGASAPIAMRDLSSVIRKPRITEKAVLGTEKNVYTFEIDPRATKFDVRDAVIALFKVTPKKVHTVTKKARTYMARSKGRKISESGLKKAYVYLKDGDKIDLV